MIGSYNLIKKKNCISIVLFWEVRNPYFSVSDKITRQLIFYGIISVVCGSCKDKQIISKQKGFSCKTLHVFQKSILKKANLNGIILFRRLSDFDINLLYHKLYSLGLFVLFFLLKAIS